MRWRWNWLRRLRKRTMRYIGLGYRPELAAWIGAHPPEIRCLEITAEHFFDAPSTALRSLRAEYPLVVHGLGLSLGTPGPLDRTALKQYARIVTMADPLWVSEHVAFTRTRTDDLGHLNPVPPTREMLRVVADHALEVTERCRRPLILENIAAHLRPGGELSEVEFLNRLCDAAGCGLLLDVTNLYVNGRNHRFDPRAWLRECDRRRIVQVHVAGYALAEGRFEDWHADQIQDELLDLLGEVIATSPVQMITIERDARFPPTALLAGELARVDTLWAKSI
jgi:uncharacterized protein